MKSLLTFLPVILLIVPAITLAQYQPLVGIPGVGTDSSNFDQYLQAVYATSISLAALLAVIKIVIAGVKWMTTDIVSSKSAAKSDIQGAILGLIVILGAVLILYIINPNIGAVSLDLAPAPRPEPTGVGTGVGDDDEEVIDRFCALAENECVVRTCDVLGDYSWELAGVAATGGAIIGAAAGSAVPVVGGLAVGAVGGLAGGVAGAVTAYKAQLAINRGECNIVCNWYEGRMTSEGCLMATDAAAYREAQLAEIRAAIAEVNGCESGEGFYIGDEYRCAVNLDDGEIDAIIDSLGVSLSEDLENSIIQRLESAFLRAEFSAENVVTDSATRAGFGQLIDGETILLIEVPTFTGANGESLQYDVQSAEYNRIQQVVSGICNDVVTAGNDEAGLANETYNNRRYISCSRP